MCAAGALVAVVASFLPWIRSGAVWRSSYDLLGLIHRLGFAPDGPIRLAVRLWPVMPLLVTVAVVAAWWSEHTAPRVVAAVSGCVGGLYAAALGIAVAVAAPDSAELAVSVAPVATAVGGVVTVLGSLLCLAVRVPSADANTR